MTTVTESEIKVVIAAIVNELDSRGRNTTFFCCSKLFPDPVLAGKATTALASYLQKTGGIAGGYSIDRYKSHTRNGTLWRAVKNDSSQYN